MWATPAFLLGIRVIYVSVSTVMEDLKIKMIYITIIKDGKLRYKGNSEGHSPKHCFLGKVTPITQAVSLYPYLSRIQSAYPILYFHLWPLQLYYFFSHIIS